MTTTPTSRPTPAEPGPAAPHRPLTARLGQYVRGSYPPAFYLPYALTWSLGVTALFVIADPRIDDWRPDGGTVLAVLTFAINLLTMRALDDIRDLDYDRVHNPKRPLASGAVRLADLVGIIAVGGVVMLALNAGRGIALAALAAQLGYAVLILVVDQRWHWPSGDDLTLSAWVSAPVQLLLNLYLYAGVLHQTGLDPSWHAVPALLVVVAGFLHLEYGRKVTRKPKPGERSYVTLYGADRTAAVAVTGAAVSVLLGLLLTRPWADDHNAEPLGWLVIAPLAFVAYGAYRFWGTRTTRWPALAAALYLLTTFLAYLVVGVVGKGLS